MADVVYLRAYDDRTRDDDEVVRTALRSGAWPEVAETLEFGLTN